jgi:Putative MetA-pathway of phenol degradation
MSAMRLLLLAGLMLACPQLFAQDLEPRRWALLPSGVNFFSLGGTYSTGDIFFDPVLQVEDVTLDFAGYGMGFVRTFEIFGETARVDVSLAYASGAWQGLLQGEPTSVRRTGFQDPTMRLSWNFYGSPTLRGQAFGQYMAQRPIQTTAGVALGIVAPLGEYFEDKLINLGNNRWAIRPQLGALHQHNKWQFETTGAVILYGDNDEFAPGTRVREQDPLWSWQGHVIYTFMPGLWASVSGGVLWGGTSYVDGLSLDDRSRISVWALSLGIPITRMQGLKVAYTNSKTHTDKGSDLGYWSLGWSLMFGH